ncbi:MAG: hypothetical protein AAF399_19470 [Bacteroidota bacterium]
MKEFDWQQVWEQQSGQAEEYFAQIDPELEAISRQRSQGVTQHIIRNSSWELGLTLLMSVSFPFLMPMGSMAFWVMTIGIAVIALVSVWLYLGLHRQLRMVPQADVLTAVREKIRIIRAFMRHLDLFMYIFFPVGFLVGFISGLLNNTDLPVSNEFWMIVGTSLLLFLPLMFALVWVFKKTYIHWLYGKHLQRLEEVLRGLEGG